MEQCPATSNPYNQPDDYYPDDAQQPKNAPDHHPKYTKDTERSKAPFKGLVADIFSPLFFFLISLEPDAVHELTVDLR